MASRAQATHSDGERPRVAPGFAPTAFAPVRVVGDPRAKNMLVHGDNLAALEWLRRGFSAKFRCIYLDPPFNTGRSFAEYDDARTAVEWRAFMEARIRATVPLLAEDGAMFLEIDDSELGQTMVLCDEIFGRACRVSTITVVRSAATGHKAKNRGPVNVTDFILVYEKEKGAWRARAERRLRRGYDDAYRTCLVNPNDDHAAWRFESLAAAVARDAGYASARLARRELGKLVFEARTLSFALANKERVVRFAQPRYEAVSAAAQRAIVASRRAPHRVLRLVRPGHPDFLLRNGNRILFLAAKVIDTKDGPRLVEPLTNVWDDVPFQGIAREGGVVFVRNKKPERLIERVLGLSTDPGDWVLDPFVGSGTTAAVAEKMGRRWVGVDDGDVLWSLAVPRMTRVVHGEDSRGITLLHRYQGGGGFSVYA